MQRGKKVGHVRKRFHSKQTLGLHASPEPGPSPAVVETRSAAPQRGRPVPGSVEATRAATVHVRALEPESTIDLERLDPPYTRWSQAHELRERVPAGAYRVRVRTVIDPATATRLTCNALRDNPVPEHEVLMIEPVEDR